MEFMTMLLVISPDVPGAEEQYTTFKIQIDTQKPLITSGYIRSQEDQEQFIARKPQDVGMVEFF